MGRIGEFIKAHKKAVILGILAVIAIAVLAAVLMPFVLSLREEENRARFTAFIDSLGPWGFLALLGIHMLQVVVAFIPGEPIEIIAGVMYGTWGGLALCLAGTLLTTVIIYFTVRHLGRERLPEIYEKEENAKYSFLFSSDNVTYLIFILFLIPGTPKDILTYLCPFTKVKPGTYFAISTFARIPSIVTSTWAGSTLAEGNLLMSALIFLGTGVIGLLGILIHQKFVKRQEKS